MLVKTGGGVGVLVICPLEEICCMRKEASSSVEEELVGVSGSWGASVSWEPAVISYKSEVYRKII